MLFIGSWVNKHKEKKGNSVVTVEVFFSESVKIGYILVFQWLFRYLVRLFESKTLKIWKFER